MSNPVGYPKRFCTICKRQISKFQTHERRLGYHTRCGMKQLASRG